MKLKPVVASLVMLGLMTPVFAKSSVASQQAVIDQNSIISPVCSEGWFNRISIGGLGSAVAITGNHDAAGTFTKLNNSSDFYVNNFNLLVNANLGCWTKATLNLAYLGAPILWNNLDDVAENSKGNLVDGTFRQIKHNIVADEAYISIGNLAKTPFYAKLGKMYVPFGDYSDPYTPIQIMSPAQMLAQTNAPTAVVGVTTDFGFYASAFAARGETFPRNSSSGNIRNFGGKVGFYDRLNSFNMPNAHVNFALSYINNLWDSQTFTPNPETKWTWLERTSTVRNGVKQFHPASLNGSDEYSVDRVGGVSAHADFAYEAFTMYADFVSALKDMVGSDYSSRSSRFWGANVNADLAFKTLERDSHVGAGIQWSGNGRWFADNTLGITDWARIVPKWRLVGEYKVNIFKNTDLNLVVSHGKSFDFVNKTAGLNESGRNTTLGLARLMVQF